MTIGQRLRELRIKKKMTAIELSQQMSVDKSTISKWESDNRSPDAESLKKLAEVLNVSTDYLLGKTDDPRPFPVEDTRSIEERWKDPTNDFLYAMYGEVQNLTDEQKEEILNFVDYLKSKAEKENKEKK